MPIYSIKHAGTKIHVDFFPFQNIQSYKTDTLVYPISASHIRKDFEAPNLRNDAAKAILEVAGENKKGESLVLEELEKYRPNPKLSTYHQPSDPKGHAYSTASFGLKNVRKLVTAVHPDWGEPNIRRFDGVEIPGVRKGVKTDQNEWELRELYRECFEIGARQERVDKKRTISFVILGIGYPWREAFENTVASFRIWTEHHKASSEKGFTQINILLAEVEHCRNANHLQANFNSLFDPNEFKVLATKNSDGNYAVLKSIMRNFKGVLTRKFRKGDEDDGVGKKRKRLDTDVDGGIEKKLKTDRPKCGYTTKSGSPCQRLAPKKALNQSKRKGGIPRCHYHADS